MTTTVNQIRSTFLDYFAKNGHKIVPSSPLVPDNDPTLMFTNSGMVQFKNILAGNETRDYTRAASSQKSVRAGGKHNDLDSVGYDVRHHTFFEMLGNFSFGDYFKEGAISYAWELLTKYFDLPADRLAVTIYHNDEEAYALWKKISGLPDDRIIRIATKDNFWQMGDTGPCGPCTEIFYDHGDHIWGGPPGSPEEDGDRYIEIWNIVFMQFNRQADGTMEPLPKPSVDTGMGLERIAAVLQHVNSNYDIDLFRTLIQAVAKVTGATDLSNKSLRVIADHIRSCAFLIADGVMPSNENRGYVLRRIIRRAVRHGNMLGAKETFFYKLVGPLIDVMGSAGEDLKRQQAQVEQVLKTEEEQFARTLERGLALLDEELAKLSGDTLDGETAFRLYDTYGFPVDLTADVCRERNIKVDEAGFEAAMEEQRRRAREASGFGADYNAMIRVDSASEFKGYDHLELNGKVTALFVDGKAVDAINAGQEAVVVLDQTPFYAESGGQVGDKGERIPLTIAGADTEKGTITLVIQAVGGSSRKICELNEGDYITDVVGPLGQATHIEKVGTVVCAGGGVGVAPLLPIVEAFHKAGNRVIVVLAARTKDLVILEEQMRQNSDEVIIMTDDGSYGTKGLVTNGVESVINRERVDLCVTIGPAIMMKFVSALTKKYEIPTVASLNTIMVDGTGMCGACRITVGGKTKFVCVDGPEFDAHQVDFDEMIMRLGAYKDIEKK